MTTFALVLGAWHGAWCWKLLEPDAIELGSHSPMLSRPAELADALISTL